MKPSPPNPPSSICSGSVRSKLRTGGLGEPASVHPIFFMILPRAGSPRAARLRRCHRRLQPCALCCRFAFPPSPAPRPRADLNAASRHAQRRRRGIFRIWRAGGRASHAGPRCATGAGGRRAAVAGGVRRSWQRGQSIELPGRDSMLQAFGDVPFTADTLGSPAALLDSLRGEEVEAVSGPAAMTGRIVGTAAETMSSAAAAAPRRRPRAHG